MRPPQFRIRSMMLLVLLAALALVLLRQPLLIFLVAPLTLIAWFAALMAFAVWQEWRASERSSMHSPKRIRGRTRWPH